MTIKIQGKKYPIRVTMWALLTFKRDKGRQVSELANTDLEDLLYYTWLCVKGACMQDSIAFDLDFEVYIQGVEGNPMEALIEQTMEETKKKETR